MSYYQNGLITWLLRTSEYKVYSVNEIVYPDTTFWSMENISWGIGSRNKNQAATFVFTNMFEFIRDSGVIQRSDYHDRDNWGFWLNYVTSFRKVWITFDRLLVISVYVTLDHVFVEPHGHGSLYYSSPYLILHISLRTDQTVLKYAQIPYKQCRLQIKFFFEYSYTLSVAHTHKQNWRK